MELLRFWKNRDQRAPALVVAAVAAATCLAQALLHHFPDNILVSYAQRLEWMTYDLRMRASHVYREPPAACLGAVFIDQESLSTVNRSYGFSWPWPRQMHGRLVSELTAQGASLIAFDILFEERHPFDAKTALPISPQPYPRETNLLHSVAQSGDPEYLPSAHIIGSDGYLALQMARANNVILATMGTAGDQGSWEAVQPTPLLATNALELAHITAAPDADGVLRRARAIYRDPRTGRIYWQLGLVMAAQFLELDLSKAQFTPHAIRIPNRHGGQDRIIPVDRDGAFYIDWAVAWDDPQLKRDTYHSLLQDELRRANGKTNIPAGWLGKVVVVGSVALGNNVTDQGATPLSNQTLLVSKHWNVANQLIQNRFIQRSSYLTETVLILLVSIVSGILTWRFRVLRASLLVLLCLGAYALLATALFGYARYWLPAILPLGGAFLTTHVCLITFRVVVEQKERTRVRSIFSKVVSPDVVNELLTAHNVSLSGTRRMITVFFADIRGFTNMTDEGQARAESEVKQLGLSGADAEAHLEAQACEILATVNLYLGVVADTIREHQGTFDKYIGDCAMAFWGAPTPNEQHAAGCVRAAVEAQKRIYDLNAERATRNRERELENERRKNQGTPPLPLLNLLALGTGINTGVVTVGLMGSDTHILNYTVFGREVNLASRLEGISGRGRILVSESTYLELTRLAPDLADACLTLPPVTVKGFREPVKVYEVQWRRLGGDSSYDTSLVTGGTATEVRTSHDPSHPKNP